MPFPPDSPPPNTTWDHTSSSFIWQGNREQRCFHLLKWKILIEAKTRTSHYEFEEPEQSFEIKMVMKILPGTTDYLGKFYQEQLWGAG